MCWQKAESLYIRKQCAKLYRAYNAIFAKCGKFTSEVVVLHLTACLPILMYALEVMPVSTVLVNKLSRCWFSVLARLFHVSNNSVIDSICYYTGILPPRYQIDQACMKYIIGLSKNPSANLVQDVLFCVHRNRCNVLFAKYSASVFSHIGDVAKAV